MKAYKEAATRSLSFSSKTLKILCEFVTFFMFLQLTSDESTISYGVVKSSYVDSYFELNEDPDMQSMFRRMRDKKHLVDNFTDGVERVKKKLVCHLMIISEF